MGFFNKTLVVNKFFMKDKYEVKEPKLCSKEELKTFHNLVLDGGKVQQEGLYERILNCKLLAFYFDDNEKIVAVSSIKKPQKSYIEKIIKSAKLDRLVEELNYEIGYSYTKEEFRKQGTNSKLKVELLKIIELENCTVFSTTAIFSSQRFLLDNGFVNIGKSYDGNNDIGIKYYEKRCDNN